MKEIGDRPDYLPDLLHPPEPDPNGELAKPYDPKKRKMTVDEFLALPDLEKDALIAEKVMGLPCVDDPPGNGRNCPRCSCPRYSINISAAWEVMEKVKDKIFGIWPEWSVTLNAVDSYSGVESFEHDRIEMAICMAALKVVGVIE